MDNFLGVNHNKDTKTTLGQTMECKNSTPGPTKGFIQPQGRHEFGDLTNCSIYLFKRFNLVGNVGLIQFFF